MRHSSPHIAHWTFETVDKIDKMIALNNMIKYIFRSARTS